MRRRDARPSRSARPSRRDRTRGCKQPRRAHPAEPAASPDAPDRRAATRPRISRRHEDPGCQARPRGRADLLEPAAWRCARCARCSPTRSAPTRCATLLDELADECKGRGVELVAVATGWRFQSRAEMRAVPRPPAPREAAEVFARRARDAGDHRLPPAGDARRHRGHPRRRGRAARSSSSSRTAAGSRRSAIARRRAGRRCSRRRASSSTTSAWRRSTSCRTLEGADGEPIAQAAALPDGESQATLSFAEAARRCRAGDDLRRSSPCRLQMPWNRTHERSRTIPRCRSTPAADRGDGASPSAKASRRRRAGVASRPRRPRPAASEPTAVAAKRRRRRASRPPSSAAGDAGTASARGCRRAARRVGQRRRRRMAAPKPATAASKARAPSGERSRRRNRRDRRRGDRGDDGGERGDERGFARPLPLPPNFEGPLPRHLQPAGAGRGDRGLRQVLSGEFDTESPRSPRPRRPRASACSRPSPTRPSCTRCWRRPASARAATWKTADPGRPHHGQRRAGAHRPAHLVRRPGQGQRQAGAPAHRAAAGARSSRTTSRPARSSRTTTRSTGRPCSAACRACSRASGSRSAGSTSTPKACCCSPTRASWPTS